MSHDANPINPTYTFENVYHQSPAKYNRVVQAGAGFIATGSFANSIAFQQSGSHVVRVQLVNGGIVTIPAVATTAPAAIYEMSVASVITGSISLLYYS